MVFTIKDANSDIIDLWWGFLWVVLVNEKLHFDFNEFDGFVVSVGGRHCIADGLLDELNVDYLAVFFGLDSELLVGVDGL